MERTTEPIRAVKERAHTGADDQAGLPRRTAIYLRAADDDGRSLQLLACAGYAMARHLSILDVFEDVDASGASLERPSLSALRAAIRRGEVDIVLVATVDRLARRLVDQTALILEFDQAGVALEVALGEAGIRTGMEQVIAAVTAAFTDLTHEQIGRRLADGRAAARARRLAAQAVDVATIRRVFELYTVGDGAGPLSAAEIARWMRQHTPYVVPLRAALYARASSREAREAQIAALRTEALAAGWTVTRSIEDEMGGMGLDRPGLAALRDAAQSGAIDVILVTGLDRLSRSPSELAALQDELDAAGCSIVTVRAAEV